MYAEEIGVEICRFGVPQMRNNHLTLRDRRRSCADHGVWARKAGHTKLIGTPRGRIYLANLPGVTIGLGIARLHLKECKWIAYL